MKPKKEISRRHYLSYLPATVMLICGFMYLFASCEREDDDVSPSTREMVTLNFTVNEKDFGVNDVTFRSKTVPKSLRVVPLNADTKVRVVAYETPPDYTTKVSYADYKISGSGALIPLSAPLTVAAGTYKFVIYSYNDTVSMLPFADITAAITSRDLLWGSTTTAVSTTTDNVHILLEHLFSQIKLHVSLNHAVGSIINDIQGAVFYHTFPALVVQSGTLVQGTTDRIPFEWLSSAGYTSEWYSTNHHVYTNGNYPVVSIDNVTIDSNLYNTGLPWIINYYSMPLASGYSYTLSVYFTKDGILCGDLESPSTGAWGDY